MLINKLTPKKIVQELNKYIVGQEKAKRAVASALRWRWRRMRVETGLRDEIMPKNILMIGPTGVGKTEISRRLARLSTVPFIKVDATKFTEVGYVGRDVDSIIRDLVEVSIDEVRQIYSEKMKGEAEKKAEKRILDALLPGASEETAKTREKLLLQFRAGKLDEREIEIEVHPHHQVEILSLPGMEEMTQQLQGVLQGMGGQRRKVRQMNVADAYEVCVEEEIQQLLDMTEVKDLAVERVENNGIVFIDEMDKIAENDSGRTGSDVSRHGVQRDLLPLVEGTTVSTRYGNVRTDHILFIASGAFHHSRPSDLIPELQGRFPIRVQLSALTIDDFKQILTGTRACLTRQYIALMKTERVNLSFTDDGIDEIAKMAWSANENSENIGARRLYTIMERLLDDYSFDADSLKGQSIEINAAIVREKLGEILDNAERANYIL